MTNYLYPTFRLSLLPAMLAYAALGAILAGVYGILHDQITYSISEEYFTRMKFAQFHYANFGFPPRVFVAEVGFLATWWVGFFAAWFIARMTVPAFPPGLALRYTVRGFLIVFLFALLAFVAGYLLGILRTANSDLSDWKKLTSGLGVVDLSSFVEVAYIHYASYLGGLLGLIVALIYIHRAKLRARTQSAELMQR